jgi:hypothetical protein
MTDKYDKDHSMPDRKTMLDIARRVSRLLDHRFISPMELVTDEYDGSESIEEWHRRRRGPEK